MDECLNLGMWSRDENVGQSDSGQASVPVDELYGQDGGRECNMASLNHSDDDHKMQKIIWGGIRYNKFKSSG